MRQLSSAAAAIAAVLALCSAGCGKKTEPMKPSPAQYKVRLDTTKGDVLLLVHRDWSPLGADRFYELTNAHYYDGNYFFRALRGFVVQWGISGDPQTTKLWAARSIPDDSPKVSNKIGTVVFATAGPNSRTTQVFINLGDNSRLDAQGFTPFAEVIQGMDNVMKFYTGYGDGPPNGDGPDQDQITMNGNRYLQQQYPKLDYIKTARVIQ